MNKYTKYFAIITVCVMFYMNMYKFLIFEQLKITKEHYHIFPWSEIPQISKSTPNWLSLHLIISMAHVLLSTFWLCNMFKSDVFGNMFEFHEILHYIFTIIILPNVMNFGDAELLKAVTFNGLPLLIMNIVYFGRYKYKKIIYYVALTSPIWLETFMKII